MTPSRSAVPRQLRPARADHGAAAERRDGVEQGARGRSRSGIRHAAEAEVDRCRARVEERRELGRQRFAGERVQRGELRARGRRIGVCAREHGVHREQRPVAEDQAHHVAHGCEPDAAPRWGEHPADRHLDGRHHQRPERAVCPTGEALPRHEERCVGARRKQRWAIRHVAILDTVMFCRARSRELGTSSDHQIGAERHLDQVGESRGHLLAEVANRLGQQGHRVAAEPVGACNQEIVAARPERVERHTARQRLRREVGRAAHERVMSRGAQPRAQLDHRLQVAAGPLGGQDDAHRDPSNGVARHRSARGRA